MDIPKHVAIIMDGNGRWAKERKLTRLAGHKEGINTVKKDIEAAIKNKIPYLTLYAFSSENWNRPKEEVNGLMSLLNHFLEKELKLLIENKIQLKTIGRIHELPKETYQHIEKAKQNTAHFDQLTLTIALNYSSQNEIVDAVKDIIKDANEDKIKAQELNYTKLATYLDTKDLPDPDLIIRTSGEYRLSNFLLLQSAYAEIYTSPIYWPDFNQSHFTKALTQFAQRERRFGKIS